jgi:hypothetical protein
MADFVSAMCTHPSRHELSDDENERGFLNSTIRIINIDLNNKSINVYGFAIGGYFDNKEIERLREQSRDSII